MYGASLRRKTKPWNTRVVPTPASEAAEVAEAASASAISLSEVRSWQATTRELRARLEALEREKDLYGRWRLLEDAAAEEAKEKAEAVAAKREAKLRAEFKRELEEKDGAIAALSAEIADLKEIEVEFGGELGGISEESKKEDRSETDSEHQNGLPPSTGDCSRVGLLDGSGGAYRRNPSSSLPKNGGVGNNLHHTGSGVDDSVLAEAAEAASAPRKGFRQPARTRNTDEEEATEISSGGRASPGKVGILSKVASENFEELKTAASLTSAAAVAVGGGGADRGVKTVASDAATRRVAASKEVLLRCDAAVKRAEKDAVGACAAATARHLDNESEAAAIKLQAFERERRARKDLYAREARAQEITELAHTRRSSRVLEQAEATQAVDDALLGQVEAAVEVAGAHEKKVEEEKATAKAAAGLAVEAKKEADADEARQQAAAVFWGTPEPPRQNTVKDATKQAFVRRSGVLTVAEEKALEALETVASGGVLVSEIKDGGTETSESLFEKEPASAVTLPVDATDPTLPVDATDPEEEMPTSLAPVEPVEPWVEPASPDLNFMEGVADGTAVGVVRVDRQTRRGDKQRSHMCNGYKDWTSYSVATVKSSMLVDDSTYCLKWCWPLPIEYFAVPPQELPSSNAKKNPPLVVVRPVPPQMQATTTAMSTMAASEVATGSPPFPPPSSPTVDPSARLLFSRHITSIHPVAYNLLNDGDTTSAAEAAVATNNSSKGGGNSLVGNSNTCEEEVELQVGARVGAWWQDGWYLGKIESIDEHAEKDTATDSTGDASVAGNDTTGYEEVVGDHEGAEPPTTAHSAAVAAGAAQPVVVRRAIIPAHFCWYDVQFLVQEKQDEKATEGSLSNGKTSEHGNGATSDAESGKPIPKLAAGDTGCGDDGSGAPKSLTVGCDIPWNLIKRLLVADNNDVSDGTGGTSGQRNENGAESERSPSLSSSSSSSSSSSEAVVVLSPQEVNARACAVHNFPNSKHDQRATFASLSVGAIVLAPRLKTSSPSSSHSPSMLPSAAAAPGGSGGVGATPSCQRQEVEWATARISAVHHHHARRRNYHHTQKQQQHGTFLRRFNVLFDDGDRATGVTENRIVALLTEGTSDHERTKKATTFVGSPPATLPLPASSFLPQGSFVLCALSGGGGDGGALHLAQVQRQPPSQATQQMQEQDQEKVKGSTDNGEQRLIPRHHYRSQSSEERLRSRAVYFTEGLVDGRVERRHRVERALLTPLDATSMDDDCRKKRAEEKNSLASKKMGAASDDGGGGSGKKKKGGKPKKKGKKGGGKGQGASSSAGMLEMAPPPLSVGDSVLARFGNRPSGAYFKAAVTSRRRLGPRECLYDVSYDDGDFEVALPWERVRPLARLLKKAAQELQVGDEAIVAYKGKQNLKYLAVVTARHEEESSESEEVRYSVRYSDGDVEGGVARTSVTAIDTKVQATATPWPSSTGLVELVNSGNGDEHGGDLDNGGGGGGGSSSSGSNGSSSPLVALATLSAALPHHPRAPPDMTSDVLLEASTAAASTEATAFEPTQPAARTMKPLEVGTAVMARSRGYEKWFSGVVSNVRLGCAAADKDQNNDVNNGDDERDGGVFVDGGGGGGEWVYRLKYACVEVGGGARNGPKLVFDAEESAVCGALIAPITTAMPMP